MKQRHFKKIVTITFWLGVNIIGLPIVHEHKTALYAIGINRKDKQYKQPKWFRLCS